MIGEITIPIAISHTQFFHQADQSGYLELWKKHGLKLKAVHTDGQDYIIFYGSLEVLSILMGVLYEEGHTIEGVAEA